MSTTVTAVMDGLAALITLTPNVFAWPVEAVTVPCAVVGYPSRIDYDETMGRGADLWVVPVWYTVGKGVDEAGRDDLSDVITGAGSIKELLDGAHAFGDVRVTSADITEVSIAGVAYLACKFECEVIG